MIPAPPLVTDVAHRPLPAHPRRPRAGQAGRHRRARQAAPGACPRRAARGRRPEASGPDAPIARTGDRWTGELSVGRPPPARGHAPTASCSRRCRASGDKWRLVTGEHRDVVESPVAGYVVEVAPAVGIRLKVRGKALAGVLDDGLGRARPPGPRDRPRRASSGRAASTSGGPGRSSWSARGSTPRRSRVRARWACAGSSSRRWPARTCATSSPRSGASAPRSTARRRSAILVLEGAVRRGAPVARDRAVRGARGHGGRDRRRSAGRRVRRAGADPAAPCRPTSSG